MKESFCLAACLLTAAAAFAAEPPQFQIEASFVGFSLEKPDPALLHKLDPGAKPSSPGQDLLAAPRVVTKAGQRATVEIIREVPVPGGTEDGKGAVDSGVVLEVTPDDKDGKITLTGHATIRHRLEPGDRQPLDAVTFRTRETYFGGEVVSGQPLAIQMGEAPDPSRLTLTVTRVEPRIIGQEEKHTAVPRYHVYAVNPSPADAKKLFFQGLRLVPVDPPEGDTAHPPAFLDQGTRENGFVIAGVFSPEEVGAERRLVEGSLQEIPADEVPIKVTSLLGSEGQTLDLTIQPTHESARETGTSVSVYWGSDIFLTVADAGRPADRHSLLIRQE